MRPRFLLAALFSLLLTGVGVGGAHAQNAELRGVYDRLDALQRDVQDLQRQLFAAGGAPSGQAPAGAEPSFTRLAADLEYRVQTIEDQIRTLTGQIEELNHGIQQVNGRLEKLVADVDIRLTAIEQSLAEAGGAPAPGGAEVARAEPLPGAQPEAALPLAESPAGPETLPAGPEPSRPAAALPAGTASEQYAYARDRVKELQKAAGSNEEAQVIAEAKAALSAFLEANPDDPLAENAAYWLGEVHYFSRDYEQAVVTFTRNYQKWSTGPKAPDNLLKLGMSFSGLGRTTEACQAFQELADKFSDAPVPVKQKAAQESRRAGCS